MSRFEVFESDNKKNQNDNNKTNKKLAIIEKLIDFKLGVHSTSTFLTIHWDNNSSFNNNDDFLILSKGKPENHKTFLRNQSFFTQHYDQGEQGAITDYQLKCIDENEDYHVGYVSMNKEIKSYSLIESFSFKEYAQWMSIYWEQIKDKRVRDLVLPGSHDAATYGINQSSERSPDYRSPWYAPNWLISKWSVTQSATIYKQLLFGVRYFDLRVAPTSNGQLKVQHNMFSVPIVEVLDDIARFIENKREILILHWNHLEFLSDKQHQDLQELIKLKLKHKMASREFGVNVTVKELENTPIINIYDDRFNVIKENKIQDYIENQSCFWYHHSLRSAYDFHQYHSCDSVLNFLDKELKVDHDTFWVLQCVLTVDASNYFKLCFESVFDWTMTEMHRFLKLFEKLKIQKIQTNIIMCDFVTFWPLTKYCINRNLE